MSKSYIVYRDIAPGAAEDAEASSACATANSDLLIAQEREFPAYITLERNRWILDGSRKENSGEVVAFWSESLSGEDGVFAAPPSIEIDFDEQYSSIGIYLVFDTATGEYCDKVTVQWYQNGSLLSEGTFYPNATGFLCENAVIGYDKVIITFNKTALPLRRARINQIMFGISRRYDMGELRSVGIVNEMDISALEVPVSTLDWTLETKDPIVFMFQLKQPVECWNGDNLIGVYYIDSHKRKRQGNYIINCHDALGVLDESPFSGGVYSNKSAKELITEIVDGDFEIEFEVEDTTLTGILESATKREAIQQVLFAAGWCVSTDGRETIRIFPLSEDAVAIGQDRTFPGVEVETASIVTQVIVEAHSYAEDSEGSITINGVKYAETVTEYTVNNPNVTANDKKNVKKVQGATLVSPDIGQAVAQRVYDYYLRRDSLTSDFVWQGERLGDYVTRPTPWGTEETGHIVKLEIKLSNTVVASGESLGV